MAPGVPSNPIDRLCADPDAAKRGRANQTARPRATWHGFGALAACAAALLLFTACASSVEDQIAEASALQDAGQFNESIEPLRALLAEEPDQPQANYLLGVALVQTGQLSQAVWPLEKAASDPELSLTAGLLLSSTFLGLQANEDAIRIATQVLEQDPERVAALKIRAQALLGANQREKALEDTARLRELAPDDYQAVLMHATILAELDRMEESEAAHEELEAVAARSDDPRNAARGCLARATFYKDNMKDEARAAEHFARCLKTWPTEPLALRLVTQFYDERNRTDDALAVWVNALKEEPENLQIRSGLVNRYEALGRTDDARNTVKEGVELLGSSQAWLLLADFERRTQQPDKALEAVEQAIAASPSPVDSMQFTKADLLVDLDRLEEAEAIANALSEPSFRDLILGRVLLARGDAQAALDTFEAGLRRWPNNAGGRYLAGIAANQVGDFARAESELRESLRVDPKTTDAALVLANLYLASGKNREAAENARNFISQRGKSRPDGYIAFIRAATALGNVDNARRTADALQEAGFEDEARAARVQITLTTEGPDAALAEARKNGIDLTSAKHEPVARAIADRLLAEGKGEAALEIATKAGAANPDQASLIEFQGLLLARLGRTDEAKAAFEKSLELDPDQGRAKGGLASLAAQAGDLPGAIALFDEAIAADPNETSSAYAAAQLTLATGDTAGAEKRLEEIVRRDPGQAGARNDLAWILAQENRDLDRALALAEEARRIDASPEILDTLGWVLLQRGQSEQAVEIFQQALEASPESASIRYHLGIALGRVGERQRALDTLRQAIDAGPFPESEAARSELARLEQQ